MDDGSADQYPALEYMANKGVFGTTYIIADDIGSAGKLTSEQLIALDTMGHVVGNHSKTHTEFSTLLESEIEAELSGAKSALDILGLTRGSAHVAYPADYDYPEFYIKTLTAMAATSMLTGRRTLLGPINLDLLSDLYQIPIVYMWRSTSTIDALKLAVKSAMSNGKSAAVCFHRFVDSDPDDYETIYTVFHEFVDWVIGQDYPTGTILDLYNEATA